MVLSREARYITFPDRRKGRLSSSPVRWNARSRAPVRREEPAHPAKRMDWGSMPDLTASSSSAQTEGCVLLRFSSTCYLTAPSIVGKRGFIIRSMMILESVNAEMSTKDW